MRASESSPRRFQQQKVTHVDNRIRPMPQMESIEAMDSKKVAIGRAEEEEEVRT